MWNISLRNVEPPGTLPDSQDESLETTGTINNNPNNTPNVHPGMVRRQSSMTVYPGMRDAARHSLTSRPSLSNFGGKSLSLWPSIETIRSGDRRTVGSSSLARRPHEKPISAKSIWATKKSVFKYGMENHNGTKEVGFRGYAYQDSNNILNGSRGTSSTGLADSSSESEAEDESTEIAERASGNTAKLSGNYPIPPPTAPPLPQAQSLHPGIILSPLPLRAESEHRSAYQNRNTRRRAISEAEADDPSPPNIVDGARRNNWASEDITPDMSEERTRLRPARVILPPISRKLQATLHNLPVIPPITANIHRNNNEEEVEKDNSDSVEDIITIRRLDRPRTAVYRYRTRNKHLIKLYTLSFFQLLMVAILVVILGEVEPIKLFNRQHAFWAKLTTVFMIILLLSWIFLITCKPNCRNNKWTNLVALILLTVCEGMVLGNMSANGSDVNIFWHNRQQFLLWTKYPYLNRSSTNSSVADSDYEDYLNYTDGSGDYDDPLVSPTPADNETELRLAASASAMRGHIRNYHLHRARAEAKYQKHVEPGILDPYLSISIITLAVAFTLAVCLVFVIFCMQDSMDADFFGGLLYSLTVLAGLVFILNILTSSDLWPWEWYSGMWAYLLWFFHRVVVFPIIGLLVPYTSDHSFRIDD